MNECHSMLDRYHQLQQQKKNGTVHTHTHTFFVLSSSCVDTRARQSLSPWRFRCCSPALLLTTAAFSLLTARSRLLLPSGTYNSITARTNTHTAHPITSDCTHTIYRAPNLHASRRTHTADRWCYGRPCAGGNAAIRK